MTESEAINILKKKVLENIRMKIGIYIDQAGIVVEVFNNTPNITFTNFENYTEINLISESDEVIESYVFYFIKGLK